MSRIGKTIETESRLVVAKRWSEVRSRIFCWQTSVNFFRGDGNVLNWIVVVVYNIVNMPKTTELYNLK